MLINNIFLADDDEDDRMLFEEALKKAVVPVKLTTATNGDHLMQLLDETTPPPPDVIFLDCNMPKKDGYEALIQLKRTHKYRNIPVVIYSTSTREETIRQMQKLGAHYYICKPNTFDELTHCIRDVFDRGFKKNPSQSLDRFVVR